MKALLNIDKLVKLTIQPEGDVAKLTVQIGHDEKKVGNLTELEWGQLCYAVDRVAEMKFDNAKDHIQENLSQLAIYEETLGRQSTALDELRTQLASAQGQVTQFQSTTQTLEAKCSELETATNDALAAKSAAEASINGVKFELETTTASLKESTATIETLRTVIDDLQGKLKALIGVGEQTQLPLGTQVIESGEASAVVTHQTGESAPAEFSREELFKKELEAQGVPATAESSEDETPQS